ncbi:ABC transporter permease [Streptomyces sp. NPDC005012]|uniref:ABC transporter permease n=1 Tax=Streptomyces sp. NPDC005012 TaxID=3154558 RepID=UPI0033B74C8A
MNSPSARHMWTLFRVEWKLFNRIRTNYFYAVLVPLMLLMMMRFVQEQMDLAAHGLDAGPVMVATAAGVLLIFSLYSSVTGLYVARREELVLKRLRSGEVSDPVILAGGASLYVALTVVQIVVVSAVLSLMFGSAVRQPLSAVAGLLAGVALMCTMAAATAALCRTVEATLVATLPAIFVLPMISGVYVPLDVLPDSLAQVLAYGPMTGAVDLVRSGWTGELGWAAGFARWAVTLVWAGLFAWIAARRFRWEPRV